MLRALFFLSCLSLSGDLSVSHALRLVQSPSTGVLFCFSPFVFSPFPNVFLLQPALLLLLARPPSLPYPRTSSPFVHSSARKTLASLSEKVGNMSLSSATRLVSRLASAKSSLVYTNVCLPSRAWSSRWPSCVYFLIPRSIIQPPSRLSSWLSGSSSLPILPLPWLHRPPHPSVFSFPTTSWAPS